ncbi:MAG TPA: TetR family transcriptional regulator C-terminal domain-containing protein [Streptosporangiaceae bacterium]
MTGTNGHDRRSDILDAAAAVISRQGIGDARLADIADEAGVSLGLVQHYFRRRDQLLEDAFRRESEKIEARWATVVVATDPPLERLVCCLRLCTPQGSQSAERQFGPSWAFWMEMWSHANRDATLRGQIPGIYESFGRPFRSAISDGVDLGQFELNSPLDDVIDRLISLIDGLAVRTALGALPEQRMLHLLIDATCQELSLPAATRRHAHRLGSQSNPSTSARSAALP